MSSNIVVREGTDLRGGEIVRYTLKERIYHWLSALAYMYCLFTGMALFTPYLFWIAYVLGGGPTIRFWHPIMGLVFVYSLIWMYIQWGAEMKITDDDRKWSKQVKYYVTNRDENVPPAGNFNAGQKQFFWAMFWGGVAMLITGLVMWFPELMPRNLHWVLSIMLFLHVVAALVTIAGFIIHVYMGLAFVSGGFQGILWGRVPGWWARAHHGAWYQKTAGQGKGASGQK